MRTVVVSGSPSLSSSARSLLLTSPMERSASPMARPHSGSAGHAIDSRSMLSSSNSSFVPALPGNTGPWLRHSSKVRTMLRPAIRKMARLSHTRC